MHQLFGPHSSTGTTGGDCRGAISMVSRLASGRNPTRKPDFRPGGITCIVKFVGCRSCGSDSLGAEVAALYFDMSGTPPHARQRSRSRTPPPVGWALGLPVEIVDQPPRGWACLLEASLLEASFFVFEASLLGACLLEASLFVFEASRLEACLLEASLSVSFRWVFGGPGHLRGVQQRFPPASSKPRRPGARVPPEGDIVYVTLPSRAAIASVLDVVEAWGVLFYLGGGAAAPQTSALLFWEVAATQTSALFWGVLAPPNPGVVPPPSGAKFALQEYMNRETNRETGQPLPADRIPNANNILECFEYLLTLWNTLGDMRTQSSHPVPMP